MILFLLSCLLYGAILLDLVPFLVNVLASSRLLFKFYLYSKAYFDKGELVSCCFSNCAFVKNIYYFIKF